MNKLSRKRLISLVCAAKAGDRKAFSELYTATSDAQFFTALSLIKNRELAEEAIQNTYLYALDKLPSLRTPEAFLGWLGQITYHQCLKLIEQYNRTIPSADEDILFPVSREASAEDEPLSQVLGGEKQECIRNIVETLSFDHKSVILLRFYQNLKIREIAQILNCSEGTVKSRLHYAQKQLKTTLKDNGFTGRESLFGMGAFISSALETAAGASAPGKQVRPSLRTGLTAAATAVTAVLLIGLACTTLYPTLSSVTAENKAFTNQAVPVIIDTAGNLPDRATLTAPDGSTVPVREISPGRYRANVSANGSFTAALYQKKKVTDTKSITINLIDREAPLLSGQYYTDKTVTLTLSDNLSGIDYKNTRAYTLNGIPVSPIKTDEAGNSLSFTCTAKDPLRLTLLDRAGNVSYYLLSASEVIHPAP